MKKICIFMFLGLFLALPALAQYNRYGNRSSRSNYRSRYTNNRGRSWYNDNNTYYGLRLGVTSSTVNSDDQYLNGSSSSTGLNVGFVAGTQVAYNAPVFLEGGLFYTEKGGKGYVGSKKFTYDLNYLEVPIVVKYKYYFDNQLSLQPFFGGFLACGVGGKIKNFGDREVEDSFSDDRFRRFDGGIRLGCGLSIQNIYFDLGYDIGLANICHDYFDSSHTGCFFANIGVDF